MLRFRLKITEIRYEYFEVYEGTLMGSDVKCNVSGNVMDNFALSAAAVAWNSGSIDLTMNYNIGDSGAIWWASSGSTIDPLTAIGNNFAVTEVNPVP